MLKKFRNDSDRYSPESERRFDEFPDRNDYNRFDHDDSDFYDKHDRRPDLDFGYDYNERPIFDRRPPHHDCRPDKPDFDHRPERPPHHDCERPEHDYKPHPPKGPEIFIGGKPIAPPPPKPIHPEKILEVVKEWLTRFKMW